MESQADSDTLRVVPGSLPMGVLSHYITPAHKTQATFNAIHRAVITWDRTAFNTSLMRHNEVHYIIHHFGSALLFQLRPDRYESNYGRADFVQQFEGYLLYRVSPDGNLVTIHSIGVNPDSRCLGFGTRLIYRISAMYPKARILTMVPDDAIEFCILLQKLKIKCERYKQDTNSWLFHWEGTRFL